MSAYDAERTRLGERLTEAECGLRDLQAELASIAVKEPGYQEARWLVNRQRDAVRAIQADIQRLDNRRRNIVNAALVDLLQKENPRIWARLTALAEHHADGGAV